MSEIPAELLTRKESEERKNVQIHITKTKQEIGHDTWGVAKDGWHSFKQGGWKSVILFFIFIYFLHIVYVDSSSLNITPNTVLGIEAMGVAITIFIVWLLEIKDRAKVAVFDIEGKKVLRNVVVDPYDPEDTVKYDSLEGKVTGITIWDYPESLIKTGNKYDESHRGLQLVNCLHEKDRHRHTGVYVGSVRPHKWYVQGDPIPGLASVMLVRAISPSYEKMAKKFENFIKKIEKSKPSAKREEILKLNEGFKKASEDLIYYSNEIEKIKKTGLHFDVDSFGKYTRRFVIGVALAEDYHNIKKLEMEKDPSMFVGANMVTLAENATSIIAKGIALNTVVPFLANNMFSEAIAVLAARLNVGVDDLRALQAILDRPGELMKLQPDRDKNEGMIDVR